MDKVQKLSNPECNAPPSGRMDLISAVVGAIDYRHQPCQYWLGSSPYLSYFTKQEVLGRTNRLLSFQCSQSETIEILVSKDRINSGRPNKKFRKEKGARNRSVGESVG
jgi:hypothetical protein